MACWRDFRNPMFVYLNSVLFISENREKHIEKQRGQIQGEQSWNSISTSHTGKCCSSAKICEEEEKTEPLKDDRCGWMTEKAGQVNPVSLKHHMKAAFHQG